MGRGISDPLFLSLGSLSPSIYFKKVALSKFFIIEPLMFGGGVDII